MDTNKRERLIEVGYRIPATCSRCKHSDIPVGEQWGTCKLYTYAHQKHSEEIRQMSIWHAGVCANGFEPDESFSRMVYPAHLGPFAEFIEHFEPEETR